VVTASPPTGRGVERPDTLRDFARCGGDGSVSHSGATYFLLVQKVGKDTPGGGSRAFTMPYSAAPWTPI